MTPTHPGNARSDDVNVAVVLVLFRYDGVRFEGPDLHVVLQTQKKKRKKKNKGKKKKKKKTALRQVARCGKVFTSE